MHIETLTLTNFRCFGSEGHRITFEPGLTAFIGANGSGKTAVMQALLRLCGASSEHRHVRRQDFHIPADEEEAPSERTLSIDAVFAFPEIDEEPEADEDEGDDEDDDDLTDASDGVPTFFKQMAADDEGVLKFRLRLDAKWVDDGTEDGIIEERLRSVQTLDDEYDEDADCQSVNAFDRSRLQIVYIPARRDGSSQITSFLRGRLWRAISWTKDFKDSHQRSGSALNEAFATQTAVQRIEESLTEHWQSLHTADVDATPSLRPVDLRFERFIKRVGVSFHPDEGGRERDLDELSDGQRSLFHVALTATALDLEAKLSTDADGFDADALHIPALTVLAIEEPENNLAPFFLSRIIEQIRALTSARVQALVSSHSASILGRIEPEQVRHFRLEEASRTAAVRAIRMPEGDQDASKFVREAVRAYPELYFARFVVLGEGSSEEVVLPRLADAMGLAVDRSFVAVVPLGGRHVNHLWRLLTDLRIPFATLLDLDIGRSGGGWGRVKTIYDQLLAVGKREQDILPSGWEQGFRETLEELDASEVDEELDKWVEHLHQHAVFFCTPLDLDMSMLLAFADEYRRLEAGKRGPKTVAQAAKAVLGKDGSPDEYDLKDWKDEFHWYQYLFLGRGKPTTHMHVLSRLTDAVLAKKAPPELRALLSHVSKRIASTDSED